jgi:hypothetical protein
MDEVGASRRNRTQSGRDLPEFDRAPTVGRLVVRVACWLSQFEVELAGIKLLVHGSDDVADRNRRRGLFNMGGGRRGNPRRVPMGHPLGELLVTSALKRSTSICEGAESFAGKAQITPCARVTRVDPKQQLKVTAGEIRLPRLEVAERKIEQNCGITRRRSLKALIDGDSARVVT